MTPISLIFAIFFTGALNFAQAGEGCWIERDSGHFSFYSDRQYIESFSSWNDAVSLWASFQKTGLCRKVYWCGTSNSANPWCETESATCRIGRDGSLFILEILGVTCDPGQTDVCVVKDTWFTAQYFSNVNDALSSVADLKGKKLCK